MQLVLGHINLNRLQRLIRGDPLSELKLESPSVCKSCLKGKITKLSFTSKGHRTKEVLEIVHYHKYGSMSVLFRYGYKYLIIFLDYYSRYDYVYLMVWKFKAVDNFKEFALEVKRQLIELYPN